MQIQAHNAILRRHGEGFETSPAPNRNGSYEDHVMATKALPSPEVLRQLLRYEPDTGKLFWLPRPVEMFSSPGSCLSWNSKHSGREALTAKSHNYRHGGILGRLCPAHRVIWALQTGQWPTDEIDHINGNGMDNSWRNLRRATRSQNEMNKGLRSNNRSGFKGVSWHAARNKWLAQIKAGGKARVLGYFADPSEAAAAYARASAAIHGPFGRTE